MSKARTIHIEGWAKDIDICASLSDNYDLEASFDFDEETMQVIPNVLVQIWTTDKKCSLDNAKRGQLRKELGDLAVVGQETGYSEYTITGFDVTSAFIGEHNLQNIVNNNYGKYVHVLITQGTVEAKKGEYIDE